MREEWREEKMNDLPTKENQKTKPTNRHTFYLWLDVNRLAESVALVFAVFVLWSVLVRAELHIDGVLSLLCVRVRGLVRAHRILVLLVRITIAPVYFPRVPRISNAAVAVVADERGVSTVLLVRFNHGRLQKEQIRNNIGHTEEDAACQHNATPFLKRVHGNGGVLVAMGGRGRGGREEGEGEEGGGEEEKERGGGWLVGCWITLASMAGVQHGHGLSHVAVTLWTERTCKGKQEENGRRTQRKQRVCQHYRKIIFACLLSSSNRSN